LLDAAIVVMKAQGAIIVDPVELKNPDQLGEAEFTVLLYEFKAGINAYLASRPGAPQTLADLIKFNATDPNELAHFGQETFDKAQAKGPLTDREYRKALAMSKRLAGRNGIDAALRKNHLDALLAPTAGLAWTTDLVNGDHYTGGSASGAAAIAGYPHITVPAGFVEGLPVGVSFIGGPWSEPTLIRIAYSYEQATRARRPPALAVAK
jgi:amidase